MKTKIQSGWMLRLFQTLQRANEQRHLYSIRTTFISTMPLMLVGAYAVVINQLPIPAYQELMESIFGDRWRMFGELCFYGTTQIVTLMVVFVICSNLAEWYNTHKHTQAHQSICGMVGLGCYVIVSITVDSPGELPFSMTGVTGLFVAMVVSIVAGELFIRISAFSKPGRLLADDPNPAVPLAFAAVRPAVFVIGAFALLRVVLVWLGVRDGFDTIVYNVLSMPYQNSNDSMGTAQLFNISTHIMWLFGIHGNNVLDEVAQTIFVPAMEQNIAALAAGAAAPNVVTKTLFDCFVYMGGAGTTLGLLIALVIFGKNRSNKVLFRFAFPNSIFNINEPLVFGIPIVLNPIYAIPFVLTPVAMLTTSTLAMEWGLVPLTTVDVSWATPIFVSGYVATGGSFAGVILQAVNLALAVLIYAPFVMLAERMAMFRFERAYKDLVNLVTSDYSPSRKLINRSDEIGAVARQLSNQLDNAVSSGEMYLNYQPIVDARTNTLHSVEALLRWKHPQHGIINPMVTIALAEETERVNKLGLWILEQGVIQRARWNDEGVRDFHVSINVSAHQLDAPNFHAQVKEILTKHKVEPPQIQIEITETAALIENEATRINLGRLHEMGITIAMDDFGVGHSSLLYLRTQPISTLKIDGSLSRDIIKHPANLDIIATIHDLCNLLHVDTVIEFVDNEVQLEKLKGIGAFLIQGYLFSPPLPGEDIPGYMKKLEADKLEANKDNKIKKENKE